MINRRTFLKSLTAGAVAAVVPLPVSAYLKTLGAFGVVANAVAGKNKCFIRYIEESTFGEHPTNNIQQLTGRDILESGSRDYPKGSILTWECPEPGLKLNAAPIKVRELG